MQRTTAWLCITRTLSGSNAQQAASLCHVRHQSSGPTQQTNPTGAAGQAVGSEEDSTPPSAARAIATMGAGALGAVAVAAVGVWGVFKMAMAVAEGTGRTLNSNNSGAAMPAATAVAGTPNQGANGLLPMQPDVPAGPVYPPSPQHRKADLQAELQALYQMPRSPAVEEQKAAIRQELQSLR
ncbi:TPA: hypothetical protein ACH3X2_008124 [Trebouxia sp. C0005]